MNYSLIKNLDSAPRVFSAYDGGKSGHKYGISIDGECWMVKYPENTRLFAGNEKRNPHIPSYTTSLLSEYIGSHIYASLGIPVHETMLGYRDGKIVVACKDFNLNHELVTFDMIKNALIEHEDDFIGGSSSSGFHGEFLDDVITVIENSELMKRAEGIKEHFWDMFIVDAFIRNNDRNNANWGVMIKKDESVLIAPVFDNGNAFFNKRNPSVAEKRIQDDESIAQDALGTGTSFFLDKTGRHIHPFAYIESLQNPDCTAALVRFAKRLDMNKVRSIINGIPEQAFGVEVISSAQKEHYIRMMEIIVERSISPTLERLKNELIQISAAPEFLPIYEPLISNLSVDDFGFER